MPAVGATPLVYTQDLPAELPADAEPVPFDTLRAAPPALSSGLPTQSCAEPSSMDVADIESALLYAELDRAEAAVSAAVAWAPCAALSAPELSALMRTWGIVAAHTEGPAQERFTIARTMFPGMAWDERFAPRYRQGFDAAQPSATETQLTVLPRGDVLIDGQPTTPNLAVGMHIVSIGSVGAWVDLLDAPDTLVLPAAYPDDALSWIADDARRSELTALLAVTLGEGERAMVHHDGVLWEGLTGRVDWTAQTPTTPEQQVDPPPLPPRRGIGPVVAISGGVLAAAGIGLAAGGYSLASSNAEPSSSVSGSDRQRRYNTGRTLSRLGLGLAIGGGLATGGGVALSVVGAP